MVERVFPGAEIDTVSHTLGVMERKGFEVLDVQSLRPHYVLTLGAWAERYRVHRTQAARMVPERVLRAWDLYLLGCKRAFQDGILSVYQCVSSPRDERGTWSLPLTREQWLSPCEHETAQAARLRAPGPGPSVANVEPS
jgi:cyclopropane-fatty-acyl-phospholipid synthase